MLNIEALQDLCRRLSTEKDTAKLEELKQALMFMLRTEEIELLGVVRRPCWHKPN
jgi:hypothetical protein